jgi:hypothetical protein
MRHRALYLAGLGLHADRKTIDKVVGGLKFSTDRSALDRRRRGALPKPLFRGDLSRPACAPR